MRRRAHLRHHFRTELPRTHIPCSLIDLFPISKLLWRPPNASPISLPAVHWSFHRRRKNGWPATMTMRITGNKIVLGGIAAILFVSLQNRYSTRRIREALGKGDLHTPAMKRKREDQLERVASLKRKNDGGHE